MIFSSIEMVQNLIKYLEYIHDQITGELEVCVFGNEKLKIPNLDKIDKKVYYR